MIFHISFLDYLTIYTPAGINAYIDYLVFKSFHYQKHAYLNIVYPLIVTQLLTSTCVLMNSWNPLELQDFVPIFAKCSGGGPPDPPLNTNPSG